MSAPREEVLNALKEKYYRNWSPHEIKGVRIELVPLPRDIPIVETHGYDPLTDTLSIKFHTDRSRHEKKLDETISILEDERGYITGINVYGVREKGIKGVEIIVKKQLDDLLSAMKEKMESLVDRSEIYKTLGKFDLNQRAISFLEELAEKNLEKLCV